MKVGRDWVHERVVHERRYGGSAKPARVHKVIEDPPPILREKINITECERPCQYLSTVELF